MKLQVDCAGACYRLRRTPSQSSITSMSSLTSLSGDVSSICLGAAGQSATVHQAQSPSHYGVRDAALFPGYEVIRTDTHGVMDIFIRLFFEI
jgi:hypothetical protein